MPYRKTSYFGNIKEAVATTLKGAQLTLRHLANAMRLPQNPPTTASDGNYFEDHRLGIVTLNYPYQAIPVPDHGRYRLHNEIDDCIVCDKCAKVCPVDCIDIEPVKSSEVIGLTLDGTPKRLYAAKFDIDMAKCCFCGLCTTVCPTECLTMTKTYDFSEFDLSNMNYHFATMTEAEVATAQKAYEEAQTAKKSAALNQEAKEIPAEQPVKPAGKPVFRPRVASETPITAEKPNVVSETPTTETPLSEEKKAEETPKRPAFRPKIQPKVEEKPIEVGETPTTETPISEEKKAEETPKRPAFRPKIQPKAEEKSVELGETPISDDGKLKVVGETPTTETPISEEKKAEETPKRPIFRPKIRPKE